MAQSSITLMVGTTKGAFLMKGDSDRQNWQITGPHCNGWSIGHLAGDPDTGRIWAGGGGAFYGAGIWHTDDQGQTWTLTRLTSGQMDAWADSEPEFAKMMGVTGDPLPFGDRFSDIWVMHYAHGRLYAGAKPATLLRSDNQGQDWQIVEALSDHPSAESWNPGAAGLVLHTIVADPNNPEKMWTGISAAGVFATEDGGTSWDRRNRLANAADCEGHHHPAAPSDGHVGHCVHHMAKAAGDGDVLYQQNHVGVWRSQDGGRSWDNASEGLPSTFGFVLQCHPRDPDTIWTLPLNGDSQGRFPPDAAAAVWKSIDGGHSWQAQRDGLPQENCYFTVLRQAMTGDRQDPAGVYFGTNSGSVFASADEGETWQEIARHMPTILSVNVLEH